MGIDFYRLATPGLHALSPCSVGMLPLSSTTIVTRAAYRPCRRALKLALVADATYHLRRKDVLQNSQGIDDQVHGQVHPSHFYVGSPRGGVYSVYYATFAPFMACRDFTANCRIIINLQEHPVFAVPISGNGSDNQKYVYSRRLNYCEFWLVHVR